MPSLASGTRASIRWTRETNGALGTQNVTPPAVTATVAITATAAAGTGDTGAFTIATSAALNGIVAGQTVLVSGATPSANNGYWKVKSVSGSIITVFDEGDVTTTASVQGIMSVAMRTLRATGRNLNLEKDTLESAEADEDGLETDVRHGFNRVVGSPGYQLSTVDFDDILEPALSDTWLPLAWTGTHTASSGFIITRSVGSNVAEGIRLGTVIKITGTGAGLYVVYNIPTVAVVHVKNIDGTEAAIPNGVVTVSVPGNRIDLATGVETLTVERGFLDVDQFQVFRGCAIDGLQVTIAPDAMINGSMNILGMSAAAVSGTALAVGATVPNTGSAPFAAFDGAIIEGGIIQAVVTSVDFTVARNRTLNPVVGSRFSPCVWEGQATIDGTLSAYFGTDVTLFNKFINETESWMFVSLIDPNDPNEFMAITMPRVKYNGAGMDPPQQGPVTMDMPFKALKATGLAGPSSTTVNSSLTIQRSNAF